LSSGDDIKKYKVSTDSIAILFAKILTKDWTANKKLIKKARIKILKQAMRNLKYGQCRRKKPIMDRMLSTSLQKSVLRIEKVRLTTLSTYKPSTCLQKESISSWRIPCITDKDTPCAEQLCNSGGCKGKVTSGCIIENL